MQRGVNKKWFFACALLLLVVGVVAYNSAGAPSTFGHSANETEVTIGGQTMTLQQAIDQNRLGGGGSGGTTIFSTPGTTSWPVPPGTTQVTVEIWGGGGNGAPGTSSSGGGGGGGAGYVKALVNLVAGTPSVDVTVGGPGLDSSFGGFVIARRGIAGSGKNGGAGGTVTLGAGATSILQANGLGGSNGGDDFGTGCGDLGWFTQPGVGGDGGVSFTPSTVGVGYVYPTCSQGSVRLATSGTLGGGGGGGHGVSSSNGLGGTGRVIITYQGTGGGSGGSVTCPSGMSRVTLSEGKVICMDTASRGSTSPLAEWNGAVACGNLGFRTCLAYELRTACSGTTDVPTITGFGSPQRELAGDSGIGNSNGIGVTNACVVVPIDGQSTDELNWRCCAG